VAAARPSRLRAPLGLAVALGAILVVALGAGIGAESLPFSSVEASPSASSNGPLRCQITHGGTAQATVVLLHQAFGDPVTVNAGEAVVFSNQTNTTHSVTEGIRGKPAPDACVNSFLKRGLRLTVTFQEPGDYAITCRRHPSMHTTVHVLPAAPSQSPAGSGSR
jgi:plastocyanin